MPAAMNNDVEFARDIPEVAGLEVIERPLSRFEKLWNHDGLRKASILLVLGAIWEAYGLWLNNPLLLPPLHQVIKALLSNIDSGALLVSTWNSFRVLLIGYALGILGASVFAICAITTRLGSDVLETLTAMLNPLPAIALLPLSLLWFGLGTASVVFVLVHAALWPVALNAQSGFQAVSPTLRMVGRNAGLRGFRYTVTILMPAALGSILSGLKIGWAFSWRTLIAAEMVFGISSNAGGLGWFIYLSKNNLEIENVFAGLLMIVIVGLLIENVVFRKIEQITVRRWGMHV